MREGTRVQLYPSMGLDPGKPINFTSGTLSNIDGEYYLITMDDRKKTEVERYLCEIEYAFIQGRWRKVDA
jgi:hypothetical protein